MKGGLCRFYRPGRTEVALLGTDRPESITYRKLGVVLRDNRRTLKVFDRRQFVFMLGATTLARGELSTLSSLLTPTTPLTTAEFAVLQQRVSQALDNLQLAYRSGKGPALEGFTEGLARLQGNLQKDPHAYLGIHGLDPTAVDRESIASSDPTTGALSLCEPVARTIQEAELRVIVGHEVAHGTPVARALQQLVQNLLRQNQIRPLSPAQIELAFAACAENEAIAEYWQLSYGQLQGAQFFRDLASHASNPSVRHAFEVSQSGVGDMAEALDEVRCGYFFANDPSETLTSSYPVQLAMGLAQQAKVNLSNHPSVRRWVVDICDRQAKHLAEAVGRKLPTQKLRVSERYRWRFENLFVTHLQR